MGHSNLLNTILFDKFIAHQRLTKVDTNKLQPFIESENAMQYWHFDKCYLYVRLKAFKNSEEYRKIMNAQIDLLHKKNGRKVLMELGDVLKLSLEDQFFTSFIFVPEMARHGLKHMAIVTNYSNLLEKLFIDNIKGSMESEMVKFAFFNALDDAECWLDEQ